MDGINLIPTAGMGGGVAGAAGLGGLGGGLLGGLLFGRGGLGGYGGYGGDFAGGSSGVPTSIILDQINANSAQLDTLSTSQLNIANQNTANILKGNCDTQQIVAAQSNALANQMAQFNAGTNLALCQLGHQSSDDISTLGSAIALGNANMAHEMAECCCQTQRAIDNVNFQSVQNTCAITNAIKDDGAATRALIVANEMQELRDKLCDAKTQIGTLQSQAFTSAALANQADLLIKHMATIANVKQPLPPV